MTPTSVDLKQTVNLPITEFPIRAGLVTAEPEWLSWVEGEQLDRLPNESRETTFCLHDGPPYPNGNIHLGHALNKVLKDIIIRSRRMMGDASHLIPGWDCHGLPIETQVLKEQKQSESNYRPTDVPAFRNRCHTFSMGYVETQKQDFKRLGIWADWEQPYLTLDAHYEATVIQLFGELARNGAIYKGRKPIHWCMNCETALAEAEIEYANHRSNSVTVHFSVTEGLISDSTKPLSILVWTTTPWTLPSNVAIAVQPDLDYVMLELDNRRVLVALNRLDDLKATFEWGNPTILEQYKGKELVGVQTKHPFEDRVAPVIAAEFVTDTDGTGFVHIAPGHGQDDYQVGMANQLPVIMPINNQGKFQEGPWAGLTVFAANQAIIEHLQACHQLEGASVITHSYPHCWRCKKPVIFRATPQWFVAMDTPLLPDNTTLRERALKAVDQTLFYPSWGQNRIRSMVENRPDWCISRQRFWGIPIPVLTCQTCGHSETKAFNEHIVNIIRQEGSMAWFEKDASYFIPAGATCSQCGGQHFEKETDILDVWFESGASFAAVLPENQVADLILEGSDQHRGWFQSAILLGQGARGITPTRSILTHGFLVDDRGRKMSKSEGNVIAPDTIIREYGSDILRWWVASSDFKTDVSISKGILNQAKDSFSKVRNTIRFLLSNLYDFDQPIGVLEPIDQWVLHELSTLVLDIKTAYLSYDLHVVTHRIHDFCAVTLSSQYLDMVKDRLYCDAHESHRRRSSQTAIHILANQLISLIAPILVVTSDMANRHLPNPSRTIHATFFPEPTYLNDNIGPIWKEILTIKELAYQQLESMRQSKQIKSFLEASVVIQSPTPIKVDDLASILIVSHVEWRQAEQLAVTVGLASGQKCDRCWKIKACNEWADDSGSTHSLCDRCEGVVNKWVSMGTNGGDVASPVPS